MGSNSGELQKKKYGLVWEEYEEDIEEKPISLKEIKEKEIITDTNKPTNLLIEGDNIHSLKILQEEYKGRINVIYIDPPYNTGNKTFIYNDSFKNKNLEYKHSDWLSFMNKRLKLAKELLSDDGVAFISIDNNEFAQLKLLSDEIFGENNVEIMVWKKVGDGDAGAGKMKITHRFRNEHEYIVVCYKNKGLVLFNKKKELPQFKNKYRNLDGDPRGVYKGGNISKIEQNSKPSGKNYYSVMSPDKERVYTRQWHFSKEKFSELQDENRIYWGKNNHSVPQLKIFINELRPTTPVSILIGRGSTTLGVKEVREIFGDKVFDNPKPLKLVKYLLELRPSKNEIILDFFAGSGTTGHAVLDLNKEDGGNRQFILCTNNENNICENVTYQRLYKVINGYKTPKGSLVQGLGGNLKYYKIEM